MISKITGVVGNTFMPAAKRVTKMADVNSFSSFISKKSDVSSITKVFSKKGKLLGYSLIDKDGLQTIVRLGNDGKITKVPVSGGIIPESQLLGAVINCPH